MAHPPDQALSRAINDAIRQARARGMSTHDIAVFFGVADPTISRWETGARNPALDLLPRFDELVGQRRGYILRRAGYVSDEGTDVVTAILADDTIDDTTRRILVDIYSGSARRAASRADDANDSNTSAITSVNAFR